MTKQSIQELTLFGGFPCFQQQLHVNQPSVGDREIFDRYVTQAWDARWFSNNGPLVQKLEHQLEEYLDVEHCVLVNNGTTAFTLLIRAFDLTGQVVIPSFTFISTPHVLHWAGIQPIFCDIDPVTWTIDPQHCANLISEEISAVIGTHTWGYPCAISQLEEICASANIPLLFDAAHSFGCTYEKEFIGRFGSAEAFSFHATKFFHTFEGGAITTQDESLAKKLKKMRNFGFGNYDQVDMLGTNAKMSEVNAAMGLANLSAIDINLAKCKAAYEAYGYYLENIEGISLYNNICNEKSNYHYIVVEITESDFGLSRDQLLLVLNSEGIIARRYFYPGCHNLEPYSSLFSGLDEKLPHTINIGNCVMQLPGGANISAEQVKDICGLLKFVSENAHEIRTKVISLGKDHAYE